MSVMPAPALVRRSARRELDEALAVHVLMLPLYWFWAWIGLGSTFAWAAYLMLGTMWLLAGSLTVYWWREGRRGLVSRVVVWALVSSVTVLVVVLLPFRSTRRLIVPPPASTAGAQ